MDFVTEYLANADTLESIFFPIASKRRQDVRNRSGRFVHYTTADAALSIIENRALWLRNSNCMNDYSEVQHGFNLLRASLQTPGHGDALGAALEQCHAGVWKRALQEFDQWWADMRGNTFIACLSEHDEHEDRYGRLSMWRAYGGDQNARVGLVIRVPLHTGANIPLGVAFTPVAYLSPQGVQQQLRDVISGVQANQEYLSGLSQDLIYGMVFSMLRMAIVSLKHPGFSEEREWRVCFWPSMKRPAPWLLSEETKSIWGVPQKIYKIPLHDAEHGGIDGIEIPSLIDRVIIGPSQYPIPLVSTFVDALSRVGVPQAKTKVILSDIPLRT